METIAMIVAAGSGIRAGSVVPKQYVASKKNKMLSLTIQALLKSPKIDAVIVVINPKDLELYKECVKDLHGKRLLKHCFGGKERTTSVKNGLTQLKKFQPKNVLIHDAARPFISINLINEIIFSLKTHKAVLPVLPIVDSIWTKQKEESGSFRIKPGPHRENFLLAQTPQGFHYETICFAYENSKKSALDDITLVYDAGISIRTITGDPQNKKITTAQDLEIFRRTR